MSLQLLSRIKTRKAGLTKIHKASSRPETEEGPRESRARNNRLRKEKWNLAKRIGIKAGIKVQVSISPVRAKRQEVGIYWPLTHFNHRKKTSQSKQTNKKLLFKKMIGLIAENIFQHQELPCPSSETLQSVCIRPAHIQSPNQTLNTAFLTKMDN